MDLKTTGDHQAGVVPHEPKEWESYVLNQQAVLGGGGHRSFTRRRKTIVGIPTFSDFVRDYEDRSQEQRRRSRRDSQQILNDDKDGSVHDLHFGDDSLPHSLSSTASSFRRVSPHLVMPKRHHNSASRHHRHDSTPRSKLPDSFRAAADVPLPDSPETFRRTIHENKAQFYAAQKQRTHSRPRHKSLLSSILYDQPLHVLPPRPARPSSQPQAVTAYHIWRTECDEQLKNKTTMTHVPALPIPACSSCTNDSIIGGKVAPFACRHSLDELLRTGIAENRGTFAFSKAYFAILKSERQRWHTDRFGACAAHVKPQIETAAQQLFILSNALFEAEKIRIIENASFEPEPAVSRPSYRSSSFYRFWPDERPAW